MSYDFSSKIVDKTLVLLGYYSYVYYVIKDKNYEFTI
mgnify:CR=1 FL=1